MANRDGPRRFSGSNHSESGKGTVLAHNTPMGITMGTEDSELATLNEDEYGNCTITIGWRRADYPAQTSEIGKRSGPYRLMTRYIMECIAKAEAGETMLENLLEENRKWQEEHGSATVAQKTA